MGKSISCIMILTLPQIKVVEINKNMFDSTYEGGKMEMYNVLKLTDEGFAVQILQNFSMDIRPGTHAYASFSGITKKDIAMGKLKEELAGMPLGIAALDGTILFNGILQNIALHEQSDYAILSGRLLSGSVLLDTEVKSRSFQDVSMSYQDIIEKVLEDTPDAGAVFAAGTYGEPIKKPIIQYKETDWQFINRLASRCKSCIIPDITQSKPWFYFGVKQNGQAVAFDQVEYTQMASEKFYYMGAEDEGWRKGDYYHADVDSIEDCQIGDTTTFKEKSLIICEKSAMYRQNEVIFTYKLAKESYNEEKRYHNHKFSGMTLLGTVLETAAETLKIHLDIDKEQDPGTAYPYDWVPPSGNLMYLMPKIGTRVSLYLPDGDEQNAKAINCVRTNGGAEGICQTMGNFENRCLTTEHGKQMYFHPGTMGFIGGSGMMSQTDEIGTVLKSSLKMKIIAKEEIKIIAPDVTLNANLQLNMKQGR